MVDRWWGSASPCTRWARARAGYPSASWWRSWCLGRSERVPLVSKYRTSHDNSLRVPPRTSQFNRQTVTLFPHNTRQSPCFFLKRVQLYNGNYAHRGRFQPLERIRTPINKSTECGMKIKRKLCKTHKFSGFTSETGWYASIERGVWIQGNWNRNKC